MFGRKARPKRVRHEARSAAKRGLERGRHRAEALRESLPEPEEVMANLRGQAEPVLKAAREQVEKQRPAQKKSRSKKPFFFIALAVVGAVVAYILFTKRDKEPAYLMDEPQSPDASPAQPSPGMSTNGTSPGQSPSGQPSTPAGGEDVPERASAYMAQQPAQPTQAGSTETPPQSPQASVSQSSTNSGLSTQHSTSQPSAPAFGYQPRAQVAAWDLPPSSIPPMRGNASL